jgi:regulator of protease activity HflC (stomatin/prohibitin superfamily)
MFDRLIDFLLSCIELFQFWRVLDPYEKGVLLRLGKFVKVLEPGFHWVIPFHIDTAPTIHVVPSTHSLGDMSMITKDGKSMGFQAIVTFQVSDVEKALLKVADVDHAVRDACGGEIGRVLRESTWAEIIEEGDTILDRLTSACRKRGWKWGVEIMSIQLAELALVRNIRLMQK